MGRTINGKALLFCCASMATLIWFGSLLIRKKERISIAQPEPMIQISTITSTERSPSKVILAAYWRTGSTFLGELFNQNNDAFYLYEPLNGFLYPITYMKSEAIRFKDRYVHRSDFNLTYGQTSKSPLDIANFFGHVLSCNISKVDDSVFAYQYMRKSKALFEFNFCMNYDVSLVPECRHLVTPICKSSSIRAIKDVWFRLSSAKILLKEDPHVKIIHLLRDPRAILYSISRSFYAEGTFNLARSAIANCEKMLDDLSSSIQLLQFYPHAYYRLYYEVFISNPVQQASLLYDWIGVALPSEVRKYIIRMTSSLQESDRDRTQYHFDTLRANSSRTAYEWRSRVSWEFVRQVQNFDSCRKVMEIAGYRIVNNEKELRNLSISVASDLRLGGPVAPKAG